MSRSIREVADDLLVALAKNAQADANEYQQLAAACQREADRYRKEIKRRKRARVVPATVVPA